MGNQNGALPEGGADRLKDCPPFLTSKAPEFVRHIEMFDEHEHSLLDAFQYLQNRGMSQRFEGHSHKALWLQRQTDRIPFYRHMVWLYTTSHYYQRLNYALRANNEDLENLAAIIFFTREAFRSDLGAMRPFDGQLVRGIKGLTLEQLSLFTPDSCFYWPAFTSASVNTSVGNGFANHPHCGAQGRSVTFHIRCHGHFYDEHGMAQEAVKYVPCDVQPHSIDHSTGEVVLPPYTKLRSINVSVDPISDAATIWVETLEFPSVWQSIRDLDAESFEAFARRYPDVLSAHGCEVSIVNEMAKVAAEHINQVGLDMKFADLKYWRLPLPSLPEDPPIGVDDGKELLGFPDISAHSCVEVRRQVGAAEPHGLGQEKEPKAVDRLEEEQKLPKVVNRREGKQKLPEVVNRLERMMQVATHHGANLNEEDPCCGGVALDHVVRAVGNAGVAAVHGVARVVKGMIELGAKPDMERIAQIGLLKREQVIQSRSARWEYWVDDGVCGLPTGWYEYDDAASKLLSGLFHKYHTGSVAEGIASSVPSGRYGFTYDVDFAKMRQTNTTTGKVRQVRRIVSVH